MKNYSSKTKASFRRSSRNAVLFRIAIAVAVLCILIWIAGKLFGFVGSALTRPYFILRTWFIESSATVPEYLRSRTDLLSQMQQLREALSASNGYQATVARLTSENAELRSLLNVHGDQRTAAGVIGRPPFLPYDAILIDRGSVDGIKDGAVVYHDNDRAIGYVSRAYQKSALVTLFSTAGVTATAYIYGPDIYTTLYGMGGGVMRVTVPQGIPITTNDVVTLPSIDPGIVGKVSSVVSNPVEPEQSGYVVFDTPLQSLRFVAVSDRTLTHVTFDEAAQNVHNGFEEQLQVAVPPDLLIQTGTTSETGTTTGASSSPVTEQSTHQ